MDYKDYVIGLLDKVDSSEYCSICLLLTHTIDKQSGIEDMQVSDCEVIDNYGDRLSTPTCLYDMDYLESVVNKLGCIWRETEAYYAFQHTVDHIFRKGKKVKDSNVIILKLSYLQYKALLAA